MRARSKLLQSSYRYLLGASALYGVHYLHSRSPLPYFQVELDQNEAALPALVEPVVTTEHQTTIFEESPSKEEKLTVRYPSQYSIVLTDQVLSDLHIVIRHSLLPKITMGFPSHMGLFFQPNQVKQEILKKKDIMDFIHFCRENCDWQNEYEITIRDYENFLLFFEKWSKQSEDQPLFAEVASMRDVMAELLYRLHPSDFASKQLTTKELSNFFGKDVIDEEKIQHCQVVKNAAYDLQLPCNEKIRAKLDKHRVAYQIIENDASTAISVRWTHYKELVDAVRCAPVLSNNPAIFHHAFPYTLFALRQGILPMDVRKGPKAAFS